MKNSMLILSTLVMFSAANLSMATESTSAENSKKIEQDAQDEKPIGGESGQKGGIYVVGRGFKTAGTEMEKGFKAAGRGIVKGGKATGRGFKKAGGAVKDFFTGEKKD